MAGDGRGTYRVAGGRRGKQGVAGNGRGRQRKQVNAEEAGGGRGRQGEAGGCSYCYIERRRTQGRQQENVSNGR